MAGLTASLSNGMHEVLLHNILIATVAHNMCYLDWQRSFVEVGLGHQTTFSVSVLSRTRWSFDQDRSRLSQHYNGTIIMELLKFYAVCDTPIGQNH